MGGGGDGGSCGNGDPNDSPVLVASRRLALRARRRWTDVRGRDHERFIAKPNECWARHFKATEATALDGTHASPAVLAERHDRSRMRPKSGSSTSRASPAPPSAASSRHTTDRETIASVNAVAAARVAFAAGISSPDGNHTMRETGADQEQPALRRLGRHLSDPNVGGPSRDSA